MSWRRGEVWLDADVLWFGERLVPAAATVGVPVALPGPPPGLAASRRRRAERKRRRSMRRGWATLVALSPALVLGYSRAGQSAGDPVAADDPPSATFRVDPASGLAGVVEAAGSARESVTPVEPRPRIAWNHATSVGLPYAGSLVDGTQLPVAAPDWVTWNPVTDSVPNAPERLFAHERTVRAVVSVITAYRAAHPGAPRVVVGDLSRAGGGPMTDAHVSHQNGLDVDVYYPRRDGLLRAPTTTGQIDVRLAQDLVDRFVAAGAQLVLVGYSTGLRGPYGVVTPYPSHENHMHVRFPAPGG